MCEEIEGWVQIGTTCCYNYYHNGSKCVHCLAGYFGADCLQPCKAGFYGKLCVDRCNCDIKLCSHEIGCLTEFKESSIALPKNSTDSSPLQVLTIFKSHSTVYSTSKPSESISESNVTTSFITTENTNVVITTSSKRPVITTTSSKPPDTTIYLMAIGGVIALFLGILIIQFCVKLCLKRRKYSQQLFLKRTQSSSVNKGETYQDIDEALMTIRRYDNPIEHHQHGKYFELQTADQVLTSEPYEKIKSQMQYQEIADSTVVSSTSSDSNTSFTSYLKPESSKRRSYVDVIDDQDIVNEKQLGKDYELQAANPLTTESYKKINTHLQNKDIVETQVVFSTSSGSSDSDKSYLKPISTQRHTYKEVFDINNIPFQDTSLHLTDDSRNSKCSESSQYLNPIHDENSKDYSDGYLDVTHKTLFNV